MKKILRHSGVLLKLIGDLLKLNRTDARKVTLDVSTFDLDDVVQNVRSYTDELVRKSQSLEVVWSVEENLPPVTTDSVKLEEILQNLIGNASKFTARGQVEISVRNLAGRHRIEFAVADTGIGIAKQDQERIFEAFHQVGTGPRRDADGVGLGLSIVKQYLELMQGEIDVQSELGVGSTFTFTIPYSLR